MHGPKSHKVRAVTSLSALERLFEALTLVEYLHLSMNFGPDVDPFEQTAQLNGLVSFMIQNAEAIFEKVRSAPSPPASPRVEQTTPVASSSVPASPRTPASPRGISKAMVNPGLEPQVASPVPAEPVAESSGSP
jgi:hypothetical protein